MSALPIELFWEVGNLQYVINSDLLLQGISNLIVPQKIHRLGKSPRVNTLASTTITIPNTIEAYLFGEDDPHIKPDSYNLLISKIHASVDALIPVQNCMLQMTTAKDHPI